MAGRAGRAGLDTHGEVILVAPNNVRAESVMLRYGQMLTVSQLGEAVLTRLRQIFISPECRHSGS